MIYDFAVIGSGFGGSVSALRLSEKGYSVLVLEEGRKYDEKKFPKTNNNPFSFFWKPEILCYGYQRVHFFKHVSILGGTGVGGGSLVYANTLLIPKDSFFRSSDIPQHIDWKKELIPFYNVASKMLGRVKNQVVTTADNLLFQTAKKFGVEDTFYNVDVGVFFGSKDETVPDPYFNGEGPERRGCNLCGGCMIGCKKNGKNMLTKNYLYLAIKKGAKIISSRKVIDIIKKDGYFEIITKISTLPGEIKETFRANKLVISAGVIGTLELMFKLKFRGRIKISDMLGEKVRTNSESLVGVRIPKRIGKISEGVAITSGIYINPNTQIEVVRYPEGANGMSFMTTLLIDKKEGESRIKTFFKEVLKHPGRTLKALNPVGFGRQGLILLVMQDVENKIKFRATEKFLGRIKLYTETYSDSPPAPVYIPEANEFAKKMAEITGGIALSNIYEVFFDSPLTAHILGGCPIGESEKDGVIDVNHKLFGEENVYICDGSVIPANLGVNPSLTITAMSERAMSKIPPKKGKVNHVGFEVLNEKVQES